MTKTISVCWPIKPERWDILMVNTMQDKTFFHKNIPDSLIFCFVYRIPLVLHRQRSMPCHSEGVGEFMDFQWQLRGKVFLFPFHSPHFTDATEWVICVLPNCRWYKNNIYGFIAFYKFGTAFFFSQHFCEADEEFVKNFLFLFLSGLKFRLDILWAQFWGFRMSDCQKYWFNEIERKIWF